MFIEELLGLVDLGGQVGTAATIGVVQQHELAVLLADLVLVQSTFTVDWRRLVCVRSGTINRVVETYGSSRIREASRLFIRGSNPLYRVVSIS